MNVIPNLPLIEFISRYSDTESPLLSWYHIVKSADWRNHKDILKEFPLAVFSGNKKVLFNFENNTYILVTKLSYIHKTVFIKWIGKRAECCEKDINTFGSNYENN